MPKVFISHSSKDRSFIEKDLKPGLNQYGIETWYSNEDIHTAEAFERMIKKGLEQCDWFLVVLTKNAVKSDWVTTELHWALENRKGHVIPLLLRTCDPSDIDLRLGRIHYVDFRKDKSVGFKDLLAIWEIDFIPDKEKEKIRIRIIFRKALTQFRKKSVSVPSLILTILLAAIVWIFLIKASKSEHDLATIRLANYYYSKGRDSDVIATIQPLALKRNTEALKLLGNSQYKIGFALYKKNEFEQSFEFFNKSVAADSNAQAECMLGAMYYWGRGAVQKDYNQALEWLVKSSNQNNEYARLWLGDFYMNGYGVKKNKDTASKYFNWVIKNGVKANSDDARKRLAALNQN